MENKNLRRQDLVFSYLLMGASLFVFFKSIAQFFNPFGRNFARVTGDSIKENMLEWYTSPALMPFILSILLFICAFFLLKNAHKEGAKFDFFTRDKVISVIKSGQTKSFLLVSALLCVYIFVLMPFCRRYLNFFPQHQWFPFLVATFLYLVSMMIIFNEKTVKKVLISLLVAAVAAAFIAVGFGMLAMIPLP